jgi:hypothetical protein
MKRFINDSPKPISFTLGGSKYVLRGKEEFTVQDNLGEPLLAMGLPVKQIIRNEDLVPEPKDAPKLPIAEFERVMGDLNQRLDAVMGDIRRDFAALGEKLGALAVERDALAKGLSDAVARIESLEKAATAPPEKPASKAAPKQTSINNPPTPTAP